MPRTTYQAFTHVRTAETSYWSWVAEPRPTYEAAVRDILHAADQFWPLPPPTPSVALRRDAFLSRCHILGPGGSLPYAYGPIPRAPWADA